MGLEARLWNKEAKDNFYGGDEAAYQAAVLEQYQEMYVEMADRISQRRGLTNTFFLTLNTAIFTAFEGCLGHKPQGEVWWLAFPLAMLLGECFAWFYLTSLLPAAQHAKYGWWVRSRRSCQPRPTGSRNGWRWARERSPKKSWPLSHIERWSTGFLRRSLRRRVRRANRDAARMRGMAGGRGPRSGDPFAGVEQRADDGFWS